MVREEESCIYNHYFTTCVCQTVSIRFHTRSKYCQFLFQLCGEFTNLMGDCEESKSVFPYLCFVVRDYQGGSGLGFDIGRFAKMVCPHTILHYAILLH